MRGADGDQDRVLEWRKIATLAKFEFLLKVAGEIVVPRELDRRAKGCVSLHKHLAGHFATSRASGYLRKKLKGAFASAEIRQMQREIGVDDSHERDVWKMETLRNHLRTDQNVDFAGAKVSQSFAIRFLACHR